MEILLAVFILGLALFLLVRHSLTTNDPKVKSKRTEPKNAPSVSKTILSVSTNESSLAKDIDTKLQPIKQESNSNWILNPGTSYPLTLLNANKKLATIIRKTLDNEDIRENQRGQNLVELFAKHNLKIKEIEEYKEKYQEQYKNRIEDLKLSSSEWETSGERDKEDLLTGFRELAISEIYEKANCNLEVLFENQPKDITFDDDLLTTYGYDNMKVYLRYSENLDKVRVISKSNYARPTFEKLVELGLAQSGHELPLEEVLQTLTLKALNEMAQGSSQKFGRKKQAIEFILEQKDVVNEIGKYVSMRELFKLKPLPERFASINLKEIVHAWDYHQQEVQLLSITYRNSYYSWRDLKDKEFVKGYSVQPPNHVDPCPCAVDLSKKKFSRTAPPKIPQHVGCSCYLVKEYDF